MEHDTKLVSSRTSLVGASLISLSSTVFVLMGIFSLPICCGSEAPECSRSNSRVARDILAQAFYPVIRAGGWTLPASCPFLPSRDMYLRQEEKKRMENANRWYCNYCGKAFTAELYLDLHFSNRHQDAVLVGPEAVCVADHCDYLRCDVISGAKSGTYWDRTLCRQPDMDKLKQRCEAAIKSCLPTSLTGMDRHSLRDKLKMALCSLLTCERYWEGPEPERSPHSKVAYAAASCVLIVGLLLYYILAYTHFYTNNTMLKTDDNGLFSTAEEDDDHYYMNTHDRDVRSRYHQRVSRR